MPGNAAHAAPLVRERTDGTARVHQLHGAAAVVPDRMLDERDAFSAWRHADPADPPGGLVKEGTDRELELRDPVYRAHDGQPAVRRPVGRHDVAVDRRRGARVPPG